MRNRHTLLLVLALATARADDLATVRARVRAALWPTQAAAPAAAAAARAAAATLNASGLWPDIDYFAQGRANWAADAHLARTQGMAAALSAPGSPARDDAALAAALHAALGAWLTREPRFSNPNWWYKWIGINLQLQSAFVMLGANRTTPAEAALLSNFSYDSAWWLNDYGGGDNLSDMLRVQLWRGLATSNASAVAQAFAKLQADIVVGDVTRGWEGVQVDSSYHFHGAQLLSASYGAGWLATQLSFADIAAGTAWAVPAEANAVLAQFVAEGDAYLTFGKQFDWGTIGRGIDRPGTTFDWALPVASLTALAAAPAAAPWRDGVAAFAARLAGGAAPALVGTRVFWTVDFAAHHRPAWGATFKGHGNNSLWKVIGGECDNSENILGEYTGAGVLNVYSSAEADGPQRAYANIFPLLNWSMINGITAEQTPVVSCDVAPWPITDTAYVGAATDGRAAVAAHDTASRGLTAARAFVFLDDAVVALGARVTDAAPAPVRTTLVSRLLPAAGAAGGAVAVGFANGSVVAALPDGAHIFARGSVAWLNAGGVGVLLPPDADALGVDVREKTAPWAVIGPNKGTVTERLAYAWLEHGVRPTNASFAYTLVPNATAAGTAAAAAAAAAGARGAPACVTNSAAVQGAAVAGPAPADALVAAVFWSRAGGALACAAAGLRVAASADAAVLARVNATHASVTAAHPALWAAGTTLVVTLDRAATGAACASAGAGATAFSVALPAAGARMGASVTVVCALGAP